MMTPTERRRRLTFLAAAALALTVAVPAGRQPALTPGSRLLTGEAALPGIDRGLAPGTGAINPATRGERAARVTRASGSPRTRYADGSVIVKFRDDTVTSRQAALAAVGGEGLAHPAWADFEVMALPPSADAEVVAVALEARTDVEYAQARYRNHAMFRPTDPLYARQWNFPAIDMERAWDINAGATSSVTVAVLDSGVAFRDGVVRYNASAFRLEQGGPIFPALGSIAVPFAAAPDLGPASRFVAPRDFIWDDDLPFDVDGHGTHVAGTIGQATNNGIGVAGMAFNVRLMPVKVIDEVWDFIFDSPNFGSDDTVARGIRYAADNGAHIINMSIGREDGGAAPAVEAAIRYAVSKGAFVVMASGNEGAGRNRPNRLAEFAPAIDGMVAVGAVGRGLDRAYYSTSGSYVELSAPGGDSRVGGDDGGILQQMVDQQLALTFEDGPGRYTAPRFDAFGFYYLQGTSMAAPHVSGFAALLRQQGLTSPAAIEAAMKQFATDRGPAGRDDFHGAGLINPRATLRGLGLAR